MLFRTTQKLATKIKLGKRIEKPLRQNALVDWSANLFAANRQQYIILSNTQSFYSCFMPGKGITNETKFVDAALETIEQFMSQDGLGELFVEFVLPACQDASFGKTLNRSVSGSMNDLVHGARFDLECDFDLIAVGRRQNQTPLAVLLNAEGLNFNSPNGAIRLLWKNMNCE